jgi:acetyltransferase-like isoleucine patch superfamily enzyme
MKSFKEIIRGILAAGARWRLAHKLGVLFVGAGSRVNFWRIRASARGVLKVGEKSLIRADMVYEREGASIVIGNRTFIARGLFTVADRLRIGDDVMISWNVTIVDNNSHSIRYSERRDDVRLNAFEGVKLWDAIKIAPVIIEDKVWVGFGSSILKGVTIGEGAIVGANSVVTKSVPPWTIVAGNPATIIREIPTDER